jgi:hypothetical protein
MTTKRWRRFAALCVLLCGAFEPAWATVILPADFAQMVDESQLIVYGRVADVRSQMVGNRRTIESVITLGVIDALKGAPGPTVAFRSLNGHVGRYRRITVGAPEFTVGDEVVVFLRGSAPALPSIFGLNQGAYRVARARDGRAIVTQPLLLGDGATAQRVVRGDPARRSLAIEDFAQQVRTLARAR